MGLALMLADRGGSHDDLAFEAQEQLSRPPNWFFIH